ncbi:MAG: membrane protein insertion efficiency factor YidD [Limnohabitans sp.]|nr:membrane protein insertion efficiency factor YidD [Limnohabitans sp.]
MIKSLLINFVKAHRFFLSPWLGSACRFEPTCSAYSLAALEQHGAGKGSYLTLKRLARCHPWCAGGADPVPNPLFKTETRKHQTASENHSIKKPI